MRYIDNFCNKIIAAGIWVLIIKKAWLRTENTGIKHKKVNINGEGNKLPGRFATAWFTLQLPEFFQPCPLG